MKDIVLCKGIDCPRKLQCRRHIQAPRPKFQAYIIQQVSVPNPSKECRWLIDNMEKDNV